MAAIKNDTLPQHQRVKVSRRRQAVGQPFHRTLCLIIFVLGLLLVSTESIEEVDWAVSAFWMDRAPNVAATDSVVIAIDTESLQANREWPWSRDNYAELLSHLEAAGARQVFFDFDFSSPGRGDEEFARALAATSIPVYATAFRQPIVSMPGAIAEMLPNESLNPSVNLATSLYPMDVDGTVRRIVDQETFSSGPIPHMAFALSNEPSSGREYWLSFAFDEASLPIVPFTSAVTQENLSALVADKTVFVGATAIELGDEFVIPSKGLTSGVLVNAMAYEAVQQGMLVQQGPWWLVVVCLAWVSLLAALRPDQIGFRIFVLTNALNTAMLLFVAYNAQTNQGLILEIGVCLVVQGIGILSTLILSADRFAATLFQSSMSLKEKSLLVSAMMEGNQEGVILVNADGMIDRMNEKAADLLGQSEISLTGRNLKIVAPSLTPYLGADGVKATLSRKTEEQTIYFEVSAVTVASPISRSSYERRQAARPVTLLLMHDLTEQKAAEAAERRAKEAYAEASRAKSTLIDTMTHELKTPLNSVIGFADLIKKEAFGPLGAAEYKEFGALIQSGGHQLLGIVNDMLLAGRFQGQTVTLDRRPTNVTDLIHAALENAQERQAWSAPEILLDVRPLIVSLDEDVTGSALVHLLDNAAKFAGSDATVTVTVADANGDLMISVADNGPGVPTTAALTQLFQQGDGSRQRQYEGCGLGLYLADQVARAHGGSLHIKSGTGQGFEAEMTFPKAVLSTLPLNGVDAERRDWSHARAV